MCIKKANTRHGQLFKCVDINYLIVKTHYRSELRNEHKNSIQDAISKRFFGVVCKRNHLAQKKRRKRQCQRQPDALQNDRRQKHVTKTFPSRFEQAHSRFLNLGRAIGKIPSTFKELHGGGAERAGGSGPEVVCSERLRIPQFEQSIAPPEREPRYHGRIVHNVRAAK